MTNPTRILMALLAVTGCAQEPSFDGKLSHLSLPSVPSVTAPPAKLRVAPLTEALRAKGFSECNPHDPLGLGPYAPFIRLPLGQMLVPQKGGHTKDMGYDVLVHFNGADPVRKLLVQTAGGMVLVLVDKGIGGGGPYARALGSKLVFPLLRESITKALQRHSGRETAHIRRLAISAWSAGTAAVSKILSQGHEGIDAVVILDGLHGAWKQGAKRAQQPSSLDARFLTHEIAFAKRAQAGSGIFVLTHSSVDPFVFPATGTTAAQLLEELGVRARPLSPKETPFAQISSADEGGLHVWGFSGKDKEAHCAQLFVMPRIVNDVLETAWGTPKMDRSVPPTPHPDWKYRKNTAP
ncbi:MAG TPA: hypothetical protein PKD61_07655 [Polyangiaceae bacterium]|nr:hypothetical protein [Polyangiaceae bacterium]